MTLGNLERHVQGLPRVYTYLLLSQERVKLRTSTLAFHGLRRRCEGSMSAMSPLMGVKPNPGAADVGAAVAWPDAEVVGRLSPELAGCSLVLQSLDP